MTLVTRTSAPAGPATPVNAPITAIVVLTFAVYPARWVAVDLSFAIHPLLRSAVCTSRLVPRSSVVPASMLFLRRASGRFHVWRLQTLPSWFLSSVPALWLGLDLKTVKQALLRRSAVVAPLYQRNALRSLVVGPGRGLAFRPAATPVLLESLVAPGASPYHCTVARPSTRWSVPPLCSCRWKIGLSRRSASTPSCRFSRPCSSTCMP